MILRVRHAATNTWLHLSKGIVTLHHPVIIARFIYKFSDKKYPSDGNGHDDENDTDKDNVESFNERYQVYSVSQFY